jgi:hypothetical protein
VRALHRLPKSSRHREPPALLSLKTRNLMDKLLEDDSGTPRSEMPMRLWF